MDLGSGHYWSTMWTDPAWATAKVVVLSKTRCGNREFLVPRSSVLKGGSTAGQLGGRRLG